MLCRWGCTVLMHDANRSKLDVRMREGRWLGFDVDVRAHRVFWPGPGNVTVEQNVYFGMSAQLEGEESGILTMNDEQPNTPRTPSTPAVPATPQSPAPLQESPPASTLLQLQRSARLQKPSRIICDLQSGNGVTSMRGTDLHLAPGMQLPGSFTEEGKEAGGVWAVIDGTPELLEDFKGLEQVFTAETANTEVLEPRMLTEAKCWPDWPLWERAIEEELATLKAAGTWRLEEAPPGANIIGSKWVFKAKKDTTGNIACYKARLVAQGFSQIGGVDYDDTYTPVACLASSCAIIAMANRLDLELHQVDIKGAYLNGVLNEEEVLYMQHPPGYKSHDAATRVLRLMKTLYGLKQSGRCWYQKLSSIFLSLGFKQCAVNQAVFYKVVKHKNQLTVVAVHVDDCTIAASTCQLVNDLIEGLRKHVEVTDLGKLHWMLGLEIQRNCAASTIHLSQQAYIDAILHRFHLSNAKPLSMPMDPQVHLSSEQAPVSAAEFAAMRDVPY